MPLPDGRPLPGEQKRQNSVLRDPGINYYLCAHSSGLCGCYDRIKKSSGRQCKQTDEGVRLVLRAIKKAVVCQAVFRNGREDAPDLASKTMW